MGVRTVCLDPNEDDLPYIATVTLGAKAKGRGVITCTEPYECYTHYIGGRTLPCMERDCGACAAGRPARYEGFVSLVWMAGRKHEILRMTKNAMFMLKSGMIDSNDYRGTIINVERKTGRANGRVVVFVEPVCIEIAKLPSAPKLEKYLSRIWRVDGIEVLEGDQAYIAQYTQFLKITEEKGKDKNGQQNDDGGTDGKKTG